MNTSDIVNIICAGATLLFALIIGVIQIYQSRKIKEFELRQDERDEKRHTEFVDAQAAAFISKHYQDRGLLPLCAIASMHNDRFNYSREMYNEFCCNTTETQNRILERSNSSLRVIKDDNFYHKCLMILINTYTKCFPGDKDIFYDSGKYLSRSLDRYGCSRIPNNSFEYENRLTDVLAEAFRQHNNVGTPIERLSYEYGFQTSDEIDACHFASIVAQYIAIYSGNSNHEYGSEKDYGSPGGYAGEKIETMEDLFLKTVFYLYINLVLDEINPE